MPDRPSTFIQINMYENGRYDLHDLDQVKKCLKNLNKDWKRRELPVPSKTWLKLCQKPGSVKTAGGSDLSQVSGDHYEVREHAVMATAPVYVKNRHAFCFTFSFEK